MSRIFLSLLVASTVSAIAVAEEPRPLKSLEYEVTIVHLSSAEPIPADIRAYSGAAILEAVPAWRKAGKVERMTTVRMSALENQPANVHIGETVPIITGRTFNPAGGRGGFSQSAIQMEQLGTMVSCTGKVEESGAILVDVNAEQTRIGRAGNSPPKPSEPVAPAEADVTPPGRVHATAKTTISAKSGECKLIGSTWNESADGSTATLVLLVPRLIGK